MKKALFATLFLLVVAGSFAEMNKPPKKPICVPCTNYCKTHPNAPQCN